MNSPHAGSSSHGIAGIKKKLPTICKCLLYKKMETADWNVLKRSLERHIKIQCEIETDSQTARCVKQKIKRWGNFFQLKKN